MAAILSYKAPVQQGAPPGFTAYLVQTARVKVTLNCLAPLSETWAAARCVTDLIVAQSSRANSRVKGIDPMYSDCKRRAGPILGSPLSIWCWRTFWLALLAAVFQALTPTTPVQAATAVTINVFDRATGQPLAGEFRFNVHVDIAHDNASTTNPESYSPLVASGDDNNRTVQLDAGKYHVSVLAGPFPAVPGELGRDCFIDDPCGYKLGGAHFEVTGNGATTVNVYLVPNPLPLATLRVRVFHDNHSVNGEDDIPIEAGIPNMPVVISDGTGEVTVDFFGNPLCGGQCRTGPDGFAVIPNLPPLKYEVEVVPPDGSGWIQTTTIEGTHVIDAWLEEGASGFSTETGFLTAAVWFGFVKECQFGNANDTCPTNDTIPGNAGSITGRVRQFEIDTDAPGDVALGPIVPRPFIALNHISGDDEQVYTGRSNADGTFTIPNVPPGLYQLVYWDFAQDYIIQFFTVQVGPNQQVNIGDIGIPRWFGTIRGYVYADTGVARNGQVINNVPADKSGPDPARPGYANGYRDCLPGAAPTDVALCEPGIPNFDLDVRFKDGTIKYATFTDNNGYYEFPEYFEWEHFLVWEVGFGRLKQMGTTAYFTEFTNNGLTVSPVGYPYEPENQPEMGLAGLLQAQLTWAGTYQWIDTGKLPYDEGENGGISGIVYYATTRNEFDPSLALAEEYEPGIPNVTINLYEAVLDDDTDEPVVCTVVEPGCPYGQGELKRATDLPIDAVATDSWYDNLPTDCDYEYPVVGSGVFRNDPICLELPRTWNQIKDGVFDGGYAFEDTPAGAYIVEVVPPPGYHHIREEDQNTDQGDDFIPQVPPPPCAGPLHLVDDPRNPAHGTMTPLCESKLVEVVDGFNAAAEFFLMTSNSVPPPGMIRGLLVDDLILQLDPNSPLYVEKRGIPNTPIGILDFQNNEIARVYSDQDGYWEVLLPSSYTAHCPVPGGICPGMYRVVGNYPGTLENPDPNWNPNYGSLHLVFDVWPGKTTYADVALVPTSNLIPDPVAGFIDPPRCDVPADTPNVLRVSQVFGNPGAALTITGANFGTGGEVTLGGAPLAVNSWNNTSINVTIPGTHPTGAQQLLVTRNNGKTGRNGVTFHVLGNGYNPTIHQVGAGQPFATIQAGLDAAGNGDLVVVHEGIYYETLVLGKNVRLQGHGPAATIIDGRFFNFGGMTPQEFQAKVAATPYHGPAQVPMGQVITVLATNGQFGAAYNTQIDGFAIRGGSVARGNVPIGATLQGGAIYAHAFARFLEISNNLVQTNSGLTGGGIIIGQAYTNNPHAGNALNNENDDVRIHHNQVLNNGGFNLAGGIALFNGADGYDIASNVVCGNYSAEYGGGISHFGMSPGGVIRDNEVLFNYAFDEGGGIMVAGELAPNPLTLSAGSGAVTIERNLVQGNLSNDDGGGIRLLQPVDGPVTIQNNMVVNNLATDTGGGISLDDALNVRIVNNTIARNISTSTAEDADRSTCNPPSPLGSCPHGAGLVSEPHSQALRNARGLPVDSFSDPVLFNNIFWENQAYFLDGTGALPSAGIIDLEVVGTSAPRFFTPNYSLLTAPYGSGVGNVIGNPQFVQPIHLDFVATPFAGDPAFVVVLVRSNPTDPPGDYHLNAGSPAVDIGVASHSGVDAPCDDFDREPRITGASHDAGADERPGTLAPCAAPPANAPPNVNAGPDQTIILPANQVTLNGTADDGGDGPGPLTTEWTQVSGPAGVTFGDASALVTTATFPGAGAYVLRLTANDGADSAFDEVAIVVSAEPPPPPTGDLIYISLSSKGTVGGILFEDEDILAHNSDTGAWSLVFDGSLFGLGSVDINGFDFQSDGSLLLTLDAPATLPGLGAVDDSDIIRFTPTVPGNFSAGAFSLYFQGADYGLTTDNEDIDAFSFTPDGRLVVSTLGNFSVPADPTGTLSGADEDLIVLNPATGAWQLYFDGSAFALTTGGEDVWGVDLDGDSGRIYLTTQDNFAVNGASGTGGDIFTCTATPSSLNEPVTGCIFAPYWSGSAAGLNGRIIDGLDIGPPVVSPQPGAEIIYVSSSDGGKVAGVTFQDEDILAYNPTTNAWSLVFDSSLFGLGSVDVNGFNFQPDGTLLLTLDAPATLPGLGVVDDSDIIRFTPTVPGNFSAGAFSMYFDGSDYGLTTNDEGIDAFSFPPDGRLVVSTLGRFSVPAHPSGTLNGEDEDLIVLNPATGAWQLYFDGSAFGLSNGGEDVWGVDLDGDSGRIYLTTQGNFAVNGVSGKKGDIFTCTATPSSLNEPITGCIFAPYWSGSEFGLNKAIDGLDIGPAVSAAAATTPVALDATGDDELVEDDDPLNGDVMNEEEFAETVFLPLVTEGPQVDDDPLNGDTGLDVESSDEEESAERILLPLVRQ
ncbi:MAG: hypothetical protein DCC55_16425 [Chloroflexi bacterium]|nr:MAG: hypothetical protein DCC55_16425 [Chloroflexota bacterium]